METSLYLPAKGFLEAAGYAVKGEIGGGDLVGLSEGEPPVVVVCELKLSFNLERVLQAVDRAAMSAEVWIAARVSAKGRGREADKRYRDLCRRLGPDQSVQHLGGRLYRRGRPHHPATAAQQWQRLEAVDRVRRPVRAGLVGCRKLPLPGLGRW